MMKSLIWLSNKNFRRVESIPGHMMASLYYMAEYPPKGVEIIVGGWKPTYGA